MSRRRRVEDSSSAEDVSEAESEEDELERKQNDQNKHLERNQAGSESNTHKSIKKVFIAHKSIGEIQWKNVMTVSLTHPKSQAEALFLIDFRTDVEIGKPNTPFVYEILSMAHEEGLASWFIGDTVVSDGRLHVFTPLDPLFLILPALAKSSKATPILDAFADYFPTKIANILADRIPSEQLQLIATKKVSGDIEAYVYSEEATLSWLEKKARKATEYLTEKKINSSEASVSLNFSKSYSSESQNETEYLLYACEIVSNYIEEALKNKLLTKLGLPTDPERLKRKNDDVAIEDGRKKLKGSGESEGNEVKPLEDYGSSKSDNSAKKVGKDSAKQKELKKAAQGTHSLFKFFAAKPKS